MRWTREQNEYLAEHAWMGAQGAADALNAHYGTHRSAGSVRHYASRHGISLLAYAFCVDCRRAVASVNRDGRCPACAARHKIARYRETHSTVAGNQAASESEAAKLNREYERIKKRQQRM